MKRYFFTLIEVIFFTILSAVLIGYLLNFFSHMLIAQKKSEKLENFVLQETLLQTRLKTIFSSLKEPFLYTKKHPLEQKLCLYCIFDNGIDLDPNFAKILQAEIYTNSNNELILKTYPYPIKEKKYPIREDILLENISSLRFEFLTKEGKKTEYDKKYKVKPLAIKVFYTINNHPRSFSFFSSYKDFCLPILTPD